MFTIENTFCSVYKKDKIVIEYFKGVFDLCFQELFGFQITTKEGCLNSWWMVVCKTKR